MLNLHWGHSCNTTIHINASRNETKNSIRFQILKVFIVSASECTPDFATTSIGVYTDANMFWKTSWNQSFVSPWYFLHHSKSASVQVAKPKVHATTLSGFVWTVAGVLRNLSETWVHVSQNFQLEETLARARFDVRRFALVVPKENLGQVVAGVVDVVRADPTARLWMLESDNLPALNYLIVTIIVKRAVGPDSEIWAQWRGVNFVEGSELVD